MRIDLNCDMGESFGRYHLGHDEQIVEWVSSANIACGFHAGDPGVMRETVRLCLAHGVAIGAHPGLPDLAGFGRRAMAIASQEAYDLTLYQLGALAGVVKAEGGKLRHVKPHGALYHMAGSDEALAEAVAEAAARFDDELILYVPPNSALEQAGMAKGLRVAREVFADRGYAEDGRLIPRGQPGALIEREEGAVHQVLGIVQKRTVTTPGGAVVPLEGDTVCIHGDHPSAPVFARQLHTALQAHNIAVKPFWSE